MLNCFFFPNWCKMWYSYLHFLYLPITIVNSLTHSVPDMSFLPWDPVRDLFSNSFLSILYILWAYFPITIVIPLTHYFLTRPFFCGTLSQKRSKCNATGQSCHLHLSSATPTPHPPHCVFPPSIPHQHHSNPTKKNFLFSLGSDL